MGVNSKTLVMLFLFKPLYILISKAPIFCRVCNFNDSNVLLHTVWQQIKSEIFMKTMCSAVCFHFGFNVFAFSELRSGGLELSGRGKAAKAQGKEEWGDDGGSKKGEEVRLEELRDVSRGGWR